MKKAILFLTAFLVCIITFAQDSTGVSTTTGSSNWLLNNWGMVLTIVLGLYELVARYVPTIKNVSIVSLIIKIVQAIVPNNSAKGGTHE